LFNKEQIIPQLTNHARHISFLLVLGGSLFDAVSKWEKRGRCGDVEMWRGDKKIIINKKHKKDK